MVDFLNNQRSNNPEQMLLFVSFNLIGAIIDLLKKLGINCGVYNQPFYALKMSKEA